MSCGTVWCSTGGWVAMGQREVGNWRRLHSGQDVGAVCFCCCLLLLAAASQPLHPTPPPKRAPHLVLLGLGLGLLGGGRGGAASGSRGATTTTGGGGSGTCMREVDGGIAVSDDAL